MVMIAQRRTMEDPTFPYHSQTGKCLYSAQRDKALKSDDNPCEDGLRASLTSCPKNSGATVNYYHTSSSRKAQCLVYYCIFMVILLCIYGLQWTDR